MLKSILRRLKFRRDGGAPDQPWDLSTRLLSFSRKDHLTIGRACEGVLIIGGTGSGKSSASGRSLALSFLHAGMGGLVLTAKPGEAAIWKRYAEETNRVDDLIIYGPDNPWKFNFLDYEVQRKGRGAGLTENLVRLLRTVSEITKRDPGKGGDQDGGKFWEDTNSQLLRNQVDLVLMAKGSITVNDMYEVLNSAPKSIEQTRSADWQRSSYCYKCLKEAYNRPKTPIQEKDFRIVDQFWMGTFPELSEKTRSIVVSTFSSMLDVLGRGILRELFCTDTSITPEALEEGKIIVVDLPISEFSEIGKYAAAIWKFSAQMSLGRRDVQSSPRPVFLFQDEAQLFSLSGDTLFQSICRSFKVVNVLLTQNISGFYASMPGQNTEAVVDSLFANLNTKIFHANSDHTTNEWMSKQIGRAPVLVCNSSTSHDPTDAMSEALGIGPGRTTSGTSEVYEFLVQPSICTEFRVGGPANRWLVDSIILSSGSCFHATGRPYLFCTFSQKS